MKFALIAALVFVVLFIGQRLLAGDVISPEEAARRVAAGTAILIDVREPGEWRDGVVTGALLLPLSDLRGERAKWKPVLAANRDKELILYCRSGNRSGQAVRILAGEKLKATNAGGFSAWKSAGQPVRTP
jgi:rhodanese-related sulfurtransferase